MKERTYRIAQDSRRQGSAWWEWSAWIEGTEADLDAVEEVMWHLHSTFPQSMVSSRDRAAKFRLDTSGWGEFTLRATVRTREGESVPLTHELELESGEGSPAPPRRRSGGPAREPEGGAASTPPTPGRPRIYLSYSLADVDLARELEASLRKHGAKVELPNQEPLAGDSLGKSVHESIASSDAVVVVNSNAAGEFVGLESELASARSKPVFEVLVGSVKLPSGRASATPHHFHIDRKEAGPALERVTHAVLDSLRDR